MVPSLKRLHYVSEALFIVFLGLAVVLAGKSGFLRSLLAILVGASVNLISGKLELMSSFVTS